MACELWRARIDACAEGELPAEDLRAFEIHLPGCSSCAAEVLARVQFKRAVQRAGRRYSPSQEFRRRIEQNIAPRRRAPWLTIWLPRFAFIAAILVVALVLGSRWVVSQQQRTFGELADLHVATLASANPVDVVSTDRHTVKPWFAGKLPFTFNLPELQGTPFTLLGGRVAYLHQSPGAELLFQVRQHKISVFIFQDRGDWRRGLISGSSVTQELSFNMETWSASGLRYFLITDASSRDVNQLSELLKAAATAR